MKKLVQNFTVMPGMMKLISLAMLISPLMVIASVYPGGDSFSSTLSHIEQDEKLKASVITFLSTIPAFVCALMMLMKNKKSVILFPLVFILASVSPYFLVMLSDGVSSFAPFFWGVVCISGGVTAYLYFSKETRSYF